MKSVKSSFLLGSAASLGVCTSILYSNAGFGAAGALILGALLSTVIFSFIGGRLRIWLAAISVLPPFAVSSLDNIRGINRESFWEALCDTLPAIGFAFGLLVALPLAIVSLVFYFAYRRLSAPTP